MSMIPTLQETYLPDFIIANGENAAAGIGITPEIARSLYASGVDVITLGNHTWGRRDISGYLDEESRILRPANYPDGTPGYGYGIYKTKNGVTIGVANLQGRTFMDPLNDPFRTCDSIIDCFNGRAKVSFIDFHAEATSEKMALGYYIDGRVTAMVGTHTHVQTADERILPNGTAYITDVGMVGPQNSIIGMETEIIIDRFITLIPQRFQVATGAVTLCGVTIDIDEETGKALRIERIQIRDIQ